MCGEQGLLRALDVCPVQADPAELVQRPPELAAQVGTQLLTGHQRLSLGLAAGPAQTEDLRAVDPAAPVHAPDGVRLAPPLHRLGPPLGEVVLGEALQGADQLAVDHPGRERIEVSGDGRDPRLVEQRQTLLDVAVQDEEPGFGHPADGGCRVVSLRTDLDGCTGPLPSAGQVAGQHPFVSADGCQPRVGRSFVLTFEKTFCSCQPAPHRCHQGRIEEQVHRDPNGGTCGRRRLTGLYVSRMGALPRLDRRVEVAGRVRDLAKHRQISGRQGAVRVGTHEEVERLVPGAHGCGGTRALNRAGTGDIAHRASCP
jgi:hypothetical protein